MKKQKIIAVFSNCDALCQCVGRMLQSKSTCRIYKCNGSEQEPSEVRMMLSKLPI